MSNLLLQLDNDTISKFIILVCEDTLKNFDHKEYPKLKKALEDCISLSKRKDKHTVEYHEEARKLIWINGEIWTKAWQKAKTGEIEAIGRLSVEIPGVLLGGIPVNRIIGAAVDTIPWQKKKAKRYYFKSKLAEMIVKII